MKTAPKEELLAAIRDILRANIYVSRDVAMRAFKKSLECDQTIVPRLLPSALKSCPITRCTFSIC
jgi:hypothetical protein